MSDPTNTTLPVEPEVPLEVTPEVAPTEEAEESTEPVEESEAKRSFRLYMQAYKRQNPAKYAVKEQELLAKLDKIP